MKLIRIITKHLPLATVAILMAACASEDFVGDERLHEANENGRPVSFDLVAAPQTRAMYGGEAANLLNNNFVIWGEKTLSDNTTIQTVFNNYQVNYASNSHNTTTSNTAGWEYVGYKNLPYGTTTTSGGTLNTNGVATNAIASGIDQTIKYWDFGASKYDFYAYSLGKGHTTTGESPTTSYAKASAMTQGTPYSYTLEGSKDKLSTCYLSDLVEMAPANQTVQLQFRNMMAKVRVAFYETIPGYSVTKEGLKFYSDKNVTTAGDIEDFKPSLYDNGTTASIPDGGEYTVTLNPTTRHPELALTTGFTAVDKVEFGALSNYAERDYKEDTQTLGTDAAKLYLARSSNTATITPEVTALPNPDGTSLTMKMDFTLLSRDGYGEKIHVKGATATVPATYAQWQPNCLYTYIFKISDNTNVQIGAITGLYPITLDAVITQDAEGKQETITTVTNPSITTYQYGSNVEGTNEYYVSTHVVEGTHTAGPIYIVVNDNSDLATLTLGTNATLYKVTVTLTNPEIDNALVTETVAANAIANPTGAKDANGNTMTVTPVTPGTDVLSPTNQIDADDSPDGKAVVFRTPAENEDSVIYKAVKFTAEAGIYVFEYTDTTPDPDVKYYKVIKVASGS